MTPLPIPTIIDGNRLMYTKRDMIEYGKKCFAEGMACKPASGSQYPREYDDSPPTTRRDQAGYRVDDLRKFFRMTKWE